MSHAIEAVEVGVDFGATAALRDASLRVDYGETVALLGPNGAGKTTLVETLLGFRRPDRGTVRLHGLDPVRDHAEVVTRTGALLQRGGVWAPMTPRQVLTLTATYYAETRSPDELIELLDLDRCSRTPWRRLSGGEQQRTLLALALLARPRALVLDEPTTAVDPEGRAVIRDVIATERARGCAILITTHELVEAERMADRVVVLHHGRVVVDGALDDLGGEPELIVELDRPIDPTALADELDCAVTVDGARLRCAIASRPEIVAIVSAHVTRAGANLLSLRTRATLEERYLQIIADERSRT